MQGPRIACCLGPISARYSGCIDGAQELSGPHSVMLEGPCVVRNSSQVRSILAYALTVGIIFQTKTLIFIFAIFFLINAMVDKKFIFKQIF